jgi:4-methyl-5(b-hydroxyethyl)-thiazole monophosphate biosynthesis
MDLTQMDMLVLPGGLGGVASIMASEASMDAVRFAWENGKFLGAICAGPTILASLGILDGKNATCYPGCEEKMGKANILPQAAVTDGSIITGTSAGCALPFGLALIAALKGEAEAERIKDQIVIR